MKVRIIFLNIVIACLVTTLSAQTSAFTYQGRLDNSGLPANGVYDFEFGLYSSPNFNILLGTVARGGISVINGVFSVNLDFGSAPFTAINADKFLEIRVRPAGGGNYTVLSPRQPVLSTPYAIAANTASVATNANQLGGIN